MTAFALETPAVAAQTRTITVRTAGQLIQALGPDRTIRVMPGTYQLDAVPRTNTRHVSWTKVYDGWQLNVRNVKNLSIVAGPGAKPRLLVKARYAWVIKFDNARNVWLRGLVLGHIPKGGCVGGVVAFKQSRNIRIDDSELFGSGTIGVGLDKVTRFTMRRSTIRDCTYGILTIKDSRYVRFADSTFKNNAEFDLIEITRSPNVRFQNCVVEGNRTGKSGGYALFKLDRRSNVILRGGRYRNNSIDRFVNHARRLRTVGSKQFRNSIDLQVRKPDPQFNQIYTLVRYRRWLVTGTQAGIAFWDPTTGNIDVVEKAFISSTLLRQGRYLWAGTYRYVFRFDGLKVKRYLRTPNARGHAVFRGPNGGVWARQGKRYWRYDSSRDRMIPTKPRWAPGYSPYSVAFTKNRTAWTLNFMRGISRHQNGRTKTYRLRSTDYPGRDPRAFYVAANGELWVSDFTSGFYRYDSSLDRFVRDPTVTNKGVGIAVDTRNNRTWLGHYTRGVYLKRAGKQARFFAFPKLGYMRALHVDLNGDLWVAGWKGMVRMYRQRGKWLRQRYMIR